MSRITPGTAASFAALLALIALFAFAQNAFAVEPPKPPPPPADFRVEVACSPLTSSQSAQPGAPQTCRVRLRNNSDSAITGITYDRPTPNTITARYPLKASYGLSCDLTGCAPFDLAAGGSVIVVEKATFNATQDGRGRTTATATGTLNGATVTASGTEQNTLP